MNTYLSFVRFFLTLACRLSGSFHWQKTCPRWRCIPRKGFSLSSLPFPFSWLLSSERFLKGGGGEQVAAIFGKNVENRRLLMDRRRRGGERVISSSHMCGGRRGEESTSATPAVPANHPPIHAPNFKGRGKGHLDPPR